MTPEEVYHAAIKAQTEAADHAFQAQLAYITGNLKEFMKQHYDEVNERLNELYEGPTKQPEPSDPLST